MSVEVSSTDLKGPIETLVALADTWIRELETQPDMSIRRTLLMNLKRLNLVRRRDLPAPLRERILGTLTANAFGPARRDLLHRIAGHIRVDYPKMHFTSDLVALRWKTAINKYPDLEGLGNTKMVLAAYTFREEQLREYQGDHTTEYTNARCNIQLGGYSYPEIPEDLPRLDFEKECVVCHEWKKGINLCPECWQNIRKCLELKTHPHREGWDGWGYEVWLDTRPLQQLLRDGQACTPDQSPISSKETPTT
jgi:hypothetical protein